MILIIKRFFLFLLSLLLFVVVFFLYSSSATYNPADYYQVKEYNIIENQVDRDTFKIMTFNIGYLSGMTNNRAEQRKEPMFNDNLNLAVQVLNKENPDIIGFQEIDYNSARSFWVNQMDEIALQCEYPYGYQSVNWDKRYVPFPYWPIRHHFGQILSGQSILSDYPIEQTETFVLDKPGSRSFITNAFYIDRLVQKAVLNLDSGQLVVLNLHLEAFDQETRVAQATVVRKLYDSLSSEMPVLLIGDFNSTVPGGPYLSEAIEIIMGSDDIESAISLEQYNSNPEQYFTFSSGSPEYMIDFIFYNPSRIEKISSRVVNEMGEVSDHLPVVMEFVVKK